MRGGTILTILGVIASVVIAWVLVGVLFQLAWLILRIAIVLMVAVIVYFALRAVFSRARG